MSSPLREAVKQRMLLLDGAFGTMIQSRHLSESQYRSLKYTLLPGKQLGNNDLLCLSQPGIVSDIHRAYLAAGADIITTNTFNAQLISLADYGCEHLVKDINTAAARLARTVADEFSTTAWPRFVVGSIGPTNKTLSIGPDVDDPSARSLSFDDLSAAYLEQARALINGGVDGLLIETVFDTLNAKAALYAAWQAVDESNREVEIMVSATISDKSGRTLSGQTIESFVASVEHAPLLSIGLNCGFGAEQMLPSLQCLAKECRFYVSAHPNAGLPNIKGEYDQTAEAMTRVCAPLVEDNIVDILGGCCGTTPEHIASLRTLIDSKGRKCVKAIVEEDGRKLVLSGLDAVRYDEHQFISVGERCNVAGSRRFLRLIKEKKYDEAISIARQQVKNGAQIIDVNLDDAMIDASVEMPHLLRLFASEPDVARVPVMLDSSKWNVIVEGLKCLQGKGIVNSISLKEGEEIFVERAQEIARLGAAVVVMLFDEQGQATNYERRIEIASRAYRLLTERVGMAAHNIIFDPNVLAVATGIEEHNAYAIDFLRAVEWIRNNLAGVQISGGISNLSFSFRGNNYLREVMHSVFLHHGIDRGLNMAIVNVATRIPYEDIDYKLRDAVDAVLLNTRADAAEQLVSMAVAHESFVEKADAVAHEIELPLEQRLEKALIEGDASNLAKDIEEAVAKYKTAAAVIDGPLMEGMRKAGTLFAEGKMFLPQVVKTARTMKQAVAILQPYIESGKNAESGVQRRRVLLATVKGDVHDIGKNIVGVVMTCGGYDVIDLGVMVTAEQIVEAAISEKPDIIGLSGLITPSLDEMIATVRALDKAGVRCPVMIGGATTSALHTAVKIAPEYKGNVIWVHDASQNTPVANCFLSVETRQSACDDLLRDQERLRQSISLPSLASVEEARNNRLVLF